MKCKWLDSSFSTSLTVANSERGVRRAPELLPEDYMPRNGYHSGSTP